MCSFLQEKSFLQGRCPEKLHVYFALDHDKAKPHALCDSLWHPKPAQPSPKLCFPMDHPSVSCLHPRKNPWDTPGSYREGPTKMLRREGFLPRAQGKQRLGNTLRRARTLENTAGASRLPGLSNAFARIRAGCVRQTKEVPAWWKERSFPWERSQR